MRKIKKLIDKIINSKYYWIVIIASLPIFIDIDIDPGVNYLASEIYIFVVSLSLSYYLVNKYI